MTMCTNPKRLLIFLTVLVSFISCNSKEYKSEDNSKADIVNSLNKGDTQKVISSLEGKELDPDEIFYLASAHATKGGIDIYSMYPLLELRLFHEKAINWGDINKTDNKYLKILEKRPDLKEKTPEERAEVWQNSEQVLKRRFKIDRKIDCRDFTNFDTCENLGIKLEEVIEVKIENATVESGITEISYTDIQGYAYEVLGHNPNELDNNYDEQIDISNIVNVYEAYISDRLEYEIEKENFINPKTSAGFKESDSSLLLMNILWMTYEAIPLLKSLPEITVAGQDEITKAIDQLEKLRNNNQYKVKANTFIYSLSLFSLLSIYSSSFDLDKVESPTDLSCQFKAEAMVNNYPILRERFKVLLEHAKEADLPQDILLSAKPYFDYFDNLPIEMTKEAKENFIRSVNADKEYNCSIESLL